MTFCLLFGTSGWEDSLFKAVDHYWFSTSAPVCGKGGGMSIWLGRTVFITHLVFSSYIYPPICLFTPNLYSSPLLMLPIDRFAGGWNVLPITSVWALLVKCPWGVKKSLGLEISPPDAWLIKSTKKLTVNTTCSHGLFIEWSKRKSKSKMRICPWWFSTNVL